MVIFLAGLKQIPKDLYESASVDGASKFRSFFSITLPMLTPIILFNLVMQIIGSFQMFTQAFIVTKGGPKNLGRNHFPISVEVGAPIDPVEPAEALSEILRIEMDAILRHVQDGFVHEPGAYWVPRRLGGGAPTPEEAAAMDAQERAKRAR